MASYNLHKYDEDGNLSIQFQFHESRNKIQVFGGAFGNGKTTALVIKALRLARDYPGCTGLLARESYVKLNDTLRKVFLEWCPAHWVRKRPSQEDNSVYLINGSVINFRYVAQKGKTREDGQTTSNLLSATYDWIGVDQIEDPGIVYKDFLDLIGRLRGNTPYRPADGQDDPTMPSSGPRWLMVTANPSHNWFYKEIVQPYIIWRDKGIRTEKLLVDTETGVPIMDLFEGSTYTNAANLPEDYIRGLEAMYKGQMRERFLMGKWAAYEGLVYSEFNINIHTIPRRVMHQHLVNLARRHVKVRSIESYDFGITSPTCYLFGFVDDLGRVFVPNGFYEPNFHYTKHVPKILEIRRRYQDFVKFEAPYADPAIFKKQIVAGHKVADATTMAKLHADAGLRMVPANNDILNGIAKVTSYIGGSIDIPHLITGETPGPLLYVAEELEWYSDEFTNYYWKRNPQGKNMDEPVDGTDHAMDATRYLLSPLPDPSELVMPKNALPPGWMMWHEMEMSEYAARSNAVV